MLAAIDAESGNSDINQVVHVVGDLLFNIIRFDAEIRKAATNPTVADLSDVAVIYVTLRVKVRRAIRNARILERLRIEGGPTNPLARRCSSSRHVVHDHIRVYLDAKAVAASDHVHQLLSRTAPASEFVRDQLVALHTMGVGLLGPG